MTVYAVARLFFSRVIDKLLAVTVGFLVWWFGGGTAAEVQALRGQVEAQSAIISTQQQSIEQMKLCMQRIAVSGFVPTDCATFFEEK